MATWYLRYQKLSSFHSYLKKGFIAIYSFVSNRIMFCATKDLSSCHSPWTVKARNHLNTLRKFAKICLSILIINQNFFFLKCCICKNLSKITLVITRHWRKHFLKSVFMQVKLRKKKNPVPSRLADIRLGIWFPALRDFAIMHLVH